MCYRGNPPGSESQEFHLDSWVSAVSALRNPLDRPGIGEEKHVHLEIFTAETGNSFLGTDRPRTFLRMVKFGAFCPVRWGWCHSDGASKKALKHSGS